MIETNNQYVKARKPSIEVTDKYTHEIKFDGEFNGKISCEYDQEIIKEVLFSHYWHKGKHVVYFMFQAKNQERPI